VRVCYILKNIDGSGWYRCMFPAHYLTERGHYAQAPPMGFFRPDGQPASLYPDGQLPEGWVNCRFGDWPDADVYVFQMSNDPNVPRLVDEIHASGRKVVFEVDDDLLHVPPYNPFNDDPRHFHRGVQMADAVTVSTPSLRSSYRHLNKNITVLRNRLFWPMWAEVPPVYDRREWRRLRIGWMGIMEYHTADLETLNPWFGKWIAERPHIEFVSVGGPEVHDLLGIPDAQRVTTDKCDFRHLDLAYSLSVMDIGLVPLARNKFNEGKSYLKGLEYSACGIVPVCTPTAQYRELVRDGVDGFLCERPADFKHALETLDADRDRLGRMGRNAYDKAYEWTYENHILEWEDFYQEVCADRLADRQLWSVSDNPEPAGETRAPVAV
jgi:hypothetical protein